MNRLITFSMIITVGCMGRSSQEVVVYTALDQEFSQPIFREFTEKTGIVVRWKFDTEATKTVGLTAEILAERNRPRCDVFWNNEILNTLRLEKQGLLRVYRSPAAASFPAFARSINGTWHGFAARARVLLVNTDKVQPKERPTTIHDLTASKWKDRVGIAKPLFGTTATHAACLFAHWGETRAKQFFRDLKSNALVMAGNKQVALSVANGSLAFGLTDTDDAIIEIEKGMPVEIVYPDQGADGMGTLYIPNTLALIRGAPHLDESRRLVDYLLSPTVEIKLAQGRSAQIPLNPDVDTPVRVKTPATIRAMRVDFDQAAEKWDIAATFLRDLFTGAN